MGERSGILRTILDYADRQLPPAAATDPDLRRRARAGLAFAGVFLTQVPVFAMTFALMHAASASGIVALTGVALSITPSLMRRNASVANNYVICVMWATLYSLAFVLGGWRSPSLFWTAALPVMALLSLSIRASLAWLAIVALSSCSFILLRELGIQLPGIPSERHNAVLNALAVTMLACVVLGLAFSGESLRAAVSRIVERVNQDMRLVLDNVDQGFITVGADGSIGATRSVISERWFGQPNDNETFAAWIGRSNAEAGTWLGIGLTQVFDGFLPPEVAIDQLLRSLRVGDRHYALKYQPIIGRQGGLQALLVVVSDATEHVQVLRAQAAQHELMLVFMHLMRDREGVLQFFAEATELVAQWDKPEANALRLVHTLKGNAGLFGLDTVMQACHETEATAVAEGRAPSQQELAKLRSVWEETSQRIKPLLASEADPINVSEHDLLALERLVQSGAGADEIVRVLRGLRHDRAAQIFQRMAEQANALARRLGTCEVTTQIEDLGMRFDPATWAGVWSAMAHVVRNAVDHGGQPESERAAQGKPAAMTLRFESSVVDGVVRVRVSDDGAGIDWERVRKKAAERGLPHKSAEDLHEALFADGLSTKTEATVVSGRGVGLGALRDACRAIGASISVRSERGVGTCVEITRGQAYGEKRLAS